MRASYLIEIRKTVETHKSRLSDKAYRCKNCRCKLIKECSSTCRSLFNKALTQHVKKTGVMDLITRGSLADLCIRDVILKMRRLTPPPMGGDATTRRHTSTPEIPEITQMMQTKHRNCLEDFRASFKTIREVEDSIMDTEPFRALMSKIS